MVDPQRLEHGQLDDMDIPVMRPHDLEGLASFYRLQL